MECINYANAMPDAVKDDGVSPYSLSLFILCHLDPAAAGRDLKTDSSIAVGMTDKGKSE
ncbi:MAG: hypothetical protein PHR06_08300 [Candidatus Cloacimonetes bacterium]|nr:hypothetical protein [Candidatus Cloacimonadota bacterium]